MTDLTFLDITKISEELDKVRTQLRSFQPQDGEPSLGDLQAREQVLQRLLRECSPPVDLSFLFEDSELPINFCQNSDLEVVPSDQEIAHQLAGGCEICRPAAQSQDSAQDSVQPDSLNQINPLANSNAFDLYLLSEPNGTASIGQQPAQLQSEGNQFRLTFPSHPLQQGSDSPDERDVFSNNSRFTNGFYRAPALSDTPLPGTPPPPYSQYFTQTNGSVPEQSRRLQPSRPRRFETPPRPSRPPTPRTAIPAVSIQPVRPRARPLSLDIPNRNSTTPHVGLLRVDTNNNNSSNYDDSESDYEGITPPHEREYRAHLTDPSLHNCCVNKPLHILTPLCCTPRKLPCSQFHPAPPHYTSTLNLDTPGHQQYSYYAFSAAYTSYTHLRSLLRTNGATVDPPDLDDYLPCGRRKIGHGLYEARLTLNQQPVLVVGSAQSDNNNNINISNRLQTLQREIQTYLPPVRLFLARNVDFVIFSLLIVIVAVYLFL